MLKNKIKQQKEWISCTPEMDSVYTRSGFDVHLRWIPCTPEMDSAYTRSGFDVHLRWIRCTPEVDSLYTLIFVNRLYKLFYGFRNQEYNQES